MIVLDCSVTLSWIFEDETTTASEAALDRVVRDGAWVPIHFWLEVAHVLWVSERRGRLQSGQSSLFVEMLEDLQIDVDREPVDRATTTILALSRSMRLSPYDAAYVELAQRYRLPLLTNDEAMIRAATAEGVPVIRG